MKTPSADRSPATPKSFLEGCKLLLAFLQLCLELPVLLFQNFVLKAQYRHLLAQSADRADQSKKRGEPFHAADAKTNAGGGQ